MDTQQLNTIISNLTVIKGKPVYKDPKRILPGALISFQRSKKKSPYLFILKSSAGSYYKDKSGDRYNKKFCTLIKHNTGLIFI